MEHDKAKLEFLKALNKVQGLLEVVKTDSTNPHFKSHYASLTAVWEALRGPLMENGFTVLQGGHAIEGKNYLQTVLYHTGGHSESFDYPLIGNTDNPQHVASSVTYARRYSLCALVGLCVEDDDGNGATHSPAKATATPASRPQQAAQPSSEVRRISEAQAKRFYAIAKSNGKTEEDIRDYQALKLGLTKENRLMAASDYEAACKWAEEPSIEQTPF